MAASGTIALVGAGEFLEGMAEVDRHLISRVPSQPVRVAVVPTAAGLENPRAWTDMGVPHFQRLGAEAEPVLVIDRRTADDPHMAAAIRRSNFVYLSGGQPGYLLECFRDSAVWQAIMDVHAQGGVLAGCSAGAMVLGELTRVRRPGAPPGGPSSSSWTWTRGLAFLPGLAIAPHFNRMTTERLQGFIDGVPSSQTVLGIDEHTAAVGDGVEWVVMGRGRVCVIQDGRHADYTAGETFALDVVGKRG